jgi:hypothetical protein
MNAKDLYIEYSDNLTYLDEEWDAFLSDLIDSVEHRKDQEYEQSWE